MAVFCIFALLGFLDLTEELHEGNLEKYDSLITGFIYPLRSDALTGIIIAITEMGSQWAYLIVIPLIASLLYRKGHSWRLTLQATIILITTFLLNVAIKYIISRPRPLDEHQLVEVADKSFSYPSGHSMSAMAFYGFLIYLTFRLVDRNWLKWLLISVQALLILAIGGSRVYLGVHYPSDVIAGFIAGLIWLAICITALKSINFYRRTKKAEKSKPSSKKYD